MCRRYLAEIYNVIYNVPSTIVTYASTIMTAFFGFCISSLVMVKELLVKREGMEGYQE